MDEITLDDVHEALQLWEGLRKIYPISGGALGEPVGLDFEKLPELLNITPEAYAAFLHRAAQSLDSWIWMSKDEAAQTGAFMGFLVGLAAASR